MNKEVKFSRFVGIAIVVICIWIVVLALMSAIMQNENNDNMIYVDYGSGTTLNIARSNLVNHNVNLQKDIQTEKGNVSLSVKLPKINVDTETASNINDKIYSIYQNIYTEISEDETIDKIDISYTYDYLEKNTVLEITVHKEITRNDEVEKIDIKYTYDMKNDVEI